jgi:protein-tyrosine phosphatase
MPGEQRGHMFRRILMVCLGNICRSPTAEYLLRHRLGQSRDLSVSSAGISAMSGYPIDAMALQVLHEHGIEAAPHRARQLDAAMLHHADLVLVMEKHQAALLAKKMPEVSGKIFLLGKWQQSQEIPDPYHQERAVFEHVYKLIEQSVDSWLAKLAMEPRQISLKSHSKKDPEDRFAELTILSRSKQRAW